MRSGRAPAPLDTLLLFASSDFRSKARRRRRARRPVERERAQVRSGPADRAAGGVRDLCGARSVRDARPSRRRAASRPKNTACAGRSCGRKCEGDFGGAERSVFPSRRGGRAPLRVASWTGCRKGSRVSSRRITRRRARHGGEERWARRRTTGRRKISRARRRGRLSARY